MVSNFSFKHGYDNATDKEGRQSVFVGIKFPHRNRAQYFRIGLKLEPKYWNESEEWVSRKFPQFELYNTVMERTEKDLKAMELHAVKGNVPFTEVEVKKYFTKGKDFGFTSFNDYCYASLRKEKKISRKTRESILNDLKNHLDDFDPSISFNQINPELGKDFINFLHGKKLSHNTIAKIVKNVKRFSTDAYDEGKINYHPFVKKNNVRFIKTKFDFFRPNELEAIEKLDFEKGSTMWKIKMRALAGCYTGMRISDINAFHKSHIREGDNDSKLMIKTKKTDRVTSYPLKKFFNGRAYEVLHEGMDKYGKLPFMDDRDTNTNLRLLTGLAGIDRYVTFHITRHTFCTHIAHITGEIMKVMLYTGISKPETAMNYIHFAENDWY